MDHFFNLITIGIGWALGELVIYLILAGLFIVGYGLIITLVSLWNVFKRQR